MATGDLHDPFPVSSRYFNAQLPKKLISYDDPKEKKDISLETRQYSGPMKRGIAVIGSSSSMILISLLFHTNIVTAHVCPEGYSEDRSYAR